MEWVNVTANQGSVKFEGFDVYARWCLQQGQKYLFQTGELRQSFPLLVELHGISARDFADGRSLFDTQELVERWRSCLSVPRAFTDLAPGLDAGAHITAIARPDFFELLHDKSNQRLRGALSRVTLSRPIPARSLSEQGQSPLPDVAVTAARTAPAPNMVVVGIIDDGIAFGHERFRHGDGGTRIESVWIQDGDPPSPAAFGYGREIGKSGPEGIDQLLQNSTHAGAVDEDEFYLHAQAADFARPGRKAVAWRWAHGTHVLDLAAGAQPGTSPAWPIVCVQLPVAATAETSGANLAKWVIDGIWYILLQSRAIAARLRCAPLPVVINLSYGFVAGPHDGTHHIESAIDDIVDLWQAALGVKVRIVIAAGNQHLSRLHAKVSFGRPGEDVVLPWRVLPDDRTPSYVEVWLPHRPAQSPCPIELSLGTPDGMSSPLIGQPAAADFELKCAGNVVAQVTYDYVAAPTGRGMFLIAIKPTVDLEETGANNALSVAPSGTWSITLKNLSLAETEFVHAWVQRDDTPYGHPAAGRQSYFDEPAYQRLDAAGREMEEDDGRCFVQRAGAINAMATGKRTIVVGGLLRQELRAAKYSSCGPIVAPAGTTAPHRQGPDVLAVSDDSLVCAGVLAAGTRSGSVVDMNGTSVAAPMITRFIAEDLAAGGQGDRAAVARLARAQEAITSEPPARPSPERGGAGRIRLSPVNPLRV